MQLVRTLHIQKYNVNKRRLNSDTFDNYKGGISVFEYDCGIRTSGSICEHIQKFYNTTVGNPIIYVLLEYDDLKKFKGFDNIEINQSESDKGDLCHYDITGALDSNCEKFSKHHFRSPNIYMCCDGNVINLDKQQFEELHVLAEKCKTQ
jgi:hypothetical protein